MARIEAALHARLAHPPHSGRCICDRPVETHRVPLAGGDSMNALRTPTPVHLDPRCTHSSLAIAVQRLRDRANMAGPRRRITAVTPALFGTGHGTEERTRRRPMRAVPAVAQTLASGAAWTAFDEAEDARCNGGSPQPLP